MADTALCASRAVASHRKERFRCMAEETTPATALDEQLDGILRPLGVRRETSIDTVDRPPHEEEDGTLRVHLYFISVLCEWPDAPHLKERLEQLLASAEATSTD